MTVLQIISLCLSSIALGISVGVLIMSGGRK